MSLAARCYGISVGVVRHRLEIGYSHYEALGLSPGGRPMQPQLQFGL